MNFKERFQGKMLLIKKQGLDQVICSGGIPVKQINQSLTTYTTNEEQEERSSFLNKWSLVQNLKRVTVAPSVLSRNLKDANSIKLTETPMTNILGLGKILQNNHHQLKYKTKKNIGVLQTQVSARSSQRQNDLLFLPTETEPNTSNFRYSLNLINRETKAPSILRNSLSKKDILVNNNSRPSSIQNYQVTSTTNSFMQGTNRVVPKLSKTLDPREQRTDGIRWKPILVRQNAPDFTRRTVSFSQGSGGRFEQSNSLSASRYKNKPSTYVEHGNLSATAEKLAGYQRNFTDNNIPTESKQTAVLQWAGESSSPLRLIKIEQQRRQRKRFLSLSRENKMGGALLPTVAKSYQRVRVASAQYPSFANILEGSEC